MHSFRRSLLIFSVFVLLLNVGCSTNENGASIESDQQGLTGHVVIDGSGTVYPLIAMLAEQYMMISQKGIDPI